MINKVGLRQAITRLKSDFPSTLAPINSPSSLILPRPIRTPKRQM